MKNLIIKSYILLLILVTSSTLVGQLNTLRENELIFSSGVQFNDTIHEALGSKVPNYVCNQAVSSPKCTQSYGTYWQSFASNGATISTLNATLVRAQGLEEDFKIIVSGVQGNEQGDLESDASGFYTAPFEGDNANRLQYSVDGDADTFLSKDRGSFTYLQAGISVFGPSIWVRNDVDSNKASINAYRAVDWALNPAGPEPLGFNVFSPDGTASKPVLIGDYFEVNPAQKAVRIHQEGSTACDNFATGLCIEGDASVKSVIGKIGLIDSRATQNLNTNFRAFTDDRISTITGGRAYYWQDIELDTKGDIQQTSTVNYMVAYIGYISITGMDAEDSLQYWMQVGPAASEIPGVSLSDCKSDYANRSTATGLGGGWNGTADYAYNGDKVLYSSKGEFDYQGGANSEASFQFVVIENIKGYYDKLIKRDISICWAWSATAGSDNKQTNNNNEPIDVRAGYLIYGLPTGQEYQF